VHQSVSHKNKKPVCEQEQHVKKCLFGAKKV